MRKAATGAAVCAALCLAAAAATAQSPALSLDQAYSLAGRESEAVRAKELALRKSQLAAAEAWSQALPRVDAAASGSYIANPSRGYTITAGELGSFTPTIPTGALKNPVPIPLGTLSIPQEDVTIGAQEHNYFSVSATLTQPLFAWGKIRNAIDAAGILAEAAAADLSQQRLDVARETHRAYFGAVLARESLAVLQRLRDTAARVVRDREQSFDQGSTNREPVLDAAAGLAAVEARLAEAAQGLATSMESLGLLMNRDAASLSLSTGFSATLPALDEPEILETALAASPEIARGRALAGAARKKLDIARGGAMLLPDAGLGVTFSYAGQEDLPGTAWTWSNDTWDWNLIVSLSVKTSLFDGLASYSRIGQAGQDAEAASVGLAGAEKLVRLSVRRAVDAAARADASVAEKRARADLAAERLRNARASYDSGTSSMADVRGAELLAGGADLDLLYALYAREEAVADLERLTGRALGGGAAQ
jgi:outer membrane protein